MPEPQSSWTDEQVEQVMGNLLRVGVLLSAGVVLLGGAIFLIHHGMAIADWRSFQGEPENLRNPLGIVRGALALRGRPLIQLGLLLLIATPVARVVFSVFAFARQRDLTYVVITLIVLVVLVISLFAGHVDLLADEKNL